MRSSESVSLPSSKTPRNSIWMTLVVLVATSIIPLVTARSEAQSWNDGSRFAIIDSLVDQRTLRIDNSIFVRVPKKPQHQPYQEKYPFLNQYGTMDKLYARNGFYSDKPYVPSVLLAGFYQVLQWTCNLHARQDPKTFCYVMNLASAGLAYVVATWCVLRLGQLAELSQRWQVLLTASFALSTLTLPYSQSLNSHVLLLAVALGLFVRWTGWRASDAAWRHCLLFGFLAGFGYAIEQGIGQLLWGWTFLLIAFRYRRLTPLFWFLLASLPWLLAHHTINYHIGGTFKPANSLPELFRYPKGYPPSPFTEDDLTGSWRHESLSQLLLYAGGTWISHRGFLLYNLTVALGLVGLLRLSYLGKIPGSMTAYVLAWGGSTWGLYALFSTNYSGHCLSVRWFLPLLAPTYWVLAKLLKEGGVWRVDFLILSIWGAIVSVAGAWVGPWEILPTLVTIPVSNATTSWLRCPDEGCPINLAHVAGVGAILSWLAWRSWWCYKRISSSSSFWNSPRT